jgi:transposase
MYCVNLSEAQRDELKQRTCQPGIMARTRDRLEMVRLADAGWSIPRIAQHLRTGERRVRRWIRAFLEGGFDALPDKPHLGQPSALTPEMLAAIREELAKGERTWTAPQIAEWVAEKFGVHLKPTWLAYLLHRAKLSWKRTSRSLKHKQKPEEVEAKAAELEELEKGATRSV